MSRTNEELAALWVKGLGGDITALGGLMSPDTQVWHSPDGQWLTLTDSAARMAEQAAAGDVTAQGFADIRATATATGVLVQAKLAAGELGAEPVHVVQVLTALDGVINTVEEYIAPQSPSL